MSQSKGSNATTMRLEPAATPLPRYQRAGEAAPGLVLQPRDLALVEDVWRYGLLTTSQIELLRSCDPHPECRFVSRLPLTRRLKLLFHHGYLRRLSRPCAQGSVEPVYLLDREGAHALRRHADQRAEDGGSESESSLVKARAPSQMPKSAALDHLLSVVGFRVALHVACARQDDIHLLRWHPTEEVSFRAEVAQKGERTRMVTLRPDAGFVLRANGRKLFYFLEADRGGEPSAVLLAKCAVYVSYWQQGGFARDFSVPLQAGFRVLFVVPSLGRAETLLRLVRSMEAGRSMVGVAIAENVTPQRALEPVFRSADGNTLFSLTGNITQGNTKPTISKPP